MEKRKGCLWWGLRIFGAIILLFILLGAVGCMYENRSAAADQRNFPPPGELIEVNGTMMHIHCIGQGSPTVILDSGQGGWSIGWDAIVPEISELTQVCTYDRAGYGWSDPKDDGRTPQEISDDLVTLLESAGVDGPIVMAGFSYTGLSTRIVAAQHPDLVKGMLLIDPATEFDNEIAGAELAQQQQSALGAFQMFTLAARVGLVRWLDPAEIAPYAPFIPENPLQPELFYSFVSTPTWWETSTKEFANRLSDETLQYIRENGAIPNIPVVIIGAENVSDGDNDFNALNQEHLKKLEELAFQSDQGQFILAENSSHEVPRDRPDVIVQALLDLIEQTK